MLSAGVMIAGSMGGLPHGGWKATHSMGVGGKTWGLDPVD